MKTNNSTSTSRGVKWATRLFAIAISVLAFAASAKDEVPGRDTSTSRTISATPNPDGSQDLVSEVVGVGTHVGRFTGWVQTHVEPVNPANQYDLGIHALRIPITFFGTRTAANGDTWSFTGEGVVFVPLDASFMPVFPYPFYSTWKIVGGTGRFAGSTGHGTSEGFSYADGTTSAIDSGVRSTVGSNNK